MNCPHCLKSVAAWSPKINRFGNSKECPHCAKPVRLSFNMPLLLLLCVASVPIFYFMQPVVIDAGLPKWALTVIIAITAIQSSMRLTAPP